MNKIRRPTALGWIGSSWAPLLHKHYEKHHLNSDEVV